MLLKQIYRTPIPLLDGVLAVYSNLLTEAAWPEEWASSVMKQPNFQKWLKSLRIGGGIGRPMAGGAGRAYPVGDQHIVKFTTDRQEANAAAVMKGHDSEHAASIYDVRKMGMFPHPTWGQVPLFAIAMEKLNTGVGKKMRAAGEAVYSYLDKNSGFIDDPDRVADAVVKDFLGDRQDESTQQVVRNLVHALFDVQRRTGVLSQDPHGGNLAFKGRKPAFFDFGRSSIDVEHPRAAGVRVPGL